MYVGFCDASKCIPSAVSDKKHSNKILHLNLEIKIMRYKGRDSDLEKVITNLSCIFPLKHIEDDTSGSCYLGILGIGCSSFS